MLVAVTVLGAGIIGVIGVFTLCQRASARALHLEDAVNLAQSQMELAVAKPRDSLEPTAGSTGAYRWTLEYAEKPSGLVLATVTVTWPESGELETFRLSQVFRPE